MAYVRSVLFALAPFAAASVAFANPYAGMDPGQMQQLMQQAQKMQACMQQIDSEALKALEVKGKKMEQEIKTLCQQDKRAEAEQAAITHGMEMAKDPAVKTLQKCGSEMSGMMAHAMRYAHQIEQNDDDNNQKTNHICEDM